MNPLDSLLHTLQTERPVDWSSFPDLALYMDQVISYMPRQFLSTGKDNELTPAMVNNYIKDSLLPRADGKKYGRTHLAYLTMICALKQVLSVKETKFLLQQIRAEQETEPFYAEFCSALDMALSETAEALDPDLPDSDLAHLALTFALRSYADHLVCGRILHLLQEQETELAPAEPSREKGKDKNREKKGREKNRRAFENVLEAPLSAALPDSAAAPTSYTTT